MTVAPAIAAFAAAGNDIDALEKAIGEASYLDAHPGEDRQKLRATRTKVKKLKKEAVAKAEAAAKDAATKGPKERSPHTKESYDAAEFEALTAKYDKLNWRMISKPGGATVKPEDFNQLYGLHMQANEGENKTERPMWAEKGGLDFEGRARWDAWTANKGMAAEKAKLLFVKTYYEFVPKSLYKDER